MTVSPLVRTRSSPHLRPAIQGGSLFSSPPWLETLSQGYGLRFDAATWQTGGDLQLIPYARISDLKGERIVSMPFSDYCDPAVSDFEVWRQLVSQLMEERVPLAFRCLHNDLPRQDPRLTHAGEGMWHAVDLRRDEQEIWAGLGGSARQNIRKAQRGGVVVRADDSLAGVRSFHDMHRQLRRTKYHMLAQPTAFFAALHQEFSRHDGIVTLLAEVDGRTVAGILFLQWADTLYYKFNAAIDTSLCPNDLLAWEGIRLGRARGLARLDFGMSDLDQPGLIRYKRKYASEEAMVTMLRWRPPDHLNPKGEEAAALLSRMGRLLTEPGVPDEVCNAAADELYRYFC